MGSVRRQIIDIPGFQVDQNNFILLGRRDGRSCLDACRRYRFDQVSPRLPRFGPGPTDAILMVANSPFILIFLSNATHLSSLT
jgi:hypothetical protein